MKKVKFPPHSFSGLEATRPATIWIPQNPAGWNTPQIETLQRLESSQYVKLIPLVAMQGGLGVQQGDIGQIDAQSSYGS